VTIATPAVGILPRHQAVREWARLGNRHLWAVEPEGRVLRRIIRGSKHLLRQPPAISFDADWYCRYRRHFDSIVVEDVESGIIYSIDGADFDRLKERLDRGHGLQDYVRLGYWHQERAEGHQLALALFGAVAGS